MIPILPYDAFLRAVKQNANIDHVFLLGAGASKSSGVPTASDCIWEWKADLFNSKNLNSSNKYRDHNSKETREVIQKWLDKEGCYPPLNDPAEYSTYAELAYPIAESRMQYFKNICKGKEPSIGYELLCSMARVGMVRLVFTTNFDGLIVKTAHQTGVTPIEITLDTKDTIYRPSSRDELLCVALHGDYKYEQLKNTSKELDNQQEDFSNALAHHLTDKHLIVLGYSGRDKSLMDSLNKAYQERGGGVLFWCGYKDDRSQEVERLLKDINENGRKAYFISTEDFDNTLIDLAKYCFEDNEDFLQILNRSKIINSDDYKVSSITDEIGFTVKEKIPITDKIDVDTEVNKLQPYASKVAIANIIGSWNENSASDKVIISQLAREEYSDWIPKLRDVLHQPESPISLKNGRWSVTDRKALWQVLGPRLFDENLDVFKQCVVAVLTERDPMFDLPPEDRYAASIHGKVLEHSQHLRKGLSESLALLGSYPEALTNCSLNKPETIAVLAVREILKNADWKLWGSLNNLLPLFAEAAPNEFLNIVESTLQQTPCPFDELFSQEGIGLTGGNYITGLLWALETLAWDEQFLVRVSAILGELASHDPGGNWTNRPSNSLTTIFLPWLPQTTASIEKRKVALQTIQKEVPEVAWKLLLSLLPNQQKASSGSYKPVWRKTIPEDWTKDVTKNEYWEQVSFYADLAVEMAMNDIGNLNELISYLDNLPEPSFEKILKHLSSEDILAKPENERLGLWTELTEFTSRHKRFADAKWALSPDIVSKIDEVAKALVPTNPMNLHHRLFSGRDFDLYEEKGDWQEQQKQLEERRQQAIKDILEYGEIDAVLQFAETVKSSSNVGHSLGFVAKPTIDTVILPSLLETEHKNLVQLASGYVWARHRRQGWAWVDNTDTTGWSRSQIGQFLAYLPFTEETWKRANVLLDDSENEYWSKANVNPYQADCELLLAIDKLIEYGRPNAAISCLYKILHDKQPLDKARTVQALLSAVSSGEPSHTMGAYLIVEIIKALQDAPDTDPDDLFRAEWAYLPLLDRHSGASPKLLENRLASDPDFFCEVIRLTYRSKKEPKSDKEPTEQEKAIATNAWRLLHEWKTPPGMDSNGDFSESSFKQWLKSIKKACTESGHVEVALSHVGNVLIYTPPDSDGFWINHAVAEALNSKDADKMRNGFRIGIFNSRGVHMVDPTGKPEKELAAKYRKQAEEVENAGYQRFAATLRDLADSYEREAERYTSSGWRNID